MQKNKQISRKNILIVTSVFPLPLNSGGAQAQYHMIDRSRKQMNISLAYLTANEKEEEKLKKQWPEVSFCRYRTKRPFLPVRKYIKQITGLYKKLDLQNRKIINPALTHSFEANINYGFINFLEEIIKKNNIEIIQLEFADNLNLAYAFPDIKKIFLQHEIHFIRNMRFIKDPALLPACDYYQYNMLKQQEITAMNACDTVVTLTDTDKKILEKEGVKTKISVSPAIIPASCDHLPENYDYSGNIIFIGGESHQPNSEGVFWFLNNVWNNILEKKPASRLIIIGKWRKRTRKKIETEYKNVKMAGFVPSLSVYAQNSIMIVPILTGSGMRMKIIESANNGIPFITTAVGVEGLDFANNRECYIENTPGEFAAGTIKLIDDRHTQLLFRENAFKKINELYPAEELFNKRLSIYE